MIKKYLKRNIYWQRTKPFIDKDLVKIFVGQRRVGKSYFMLQIMDEIKKLHPQAHFIYIQKENYEFNDLRDDQDLAKYIQEHQKKNQKNYLFIDEVQEIKNWQKVVRSLNTSGDFDIYCTGSNADLLSGELATLLAGRYVEIKIYSLNYPEFLIFHKLEANKKSLEKYWKFGGMPYLKNLELTEEIIFDYLRNIYASILLKDVVSRYKIRSVNFLELLVEYLANNTGSLISSQRIADYLKIKKIKINTTTILEYLDYLSKTFFVHRVTRQDVLGKKIFTNNPKYFFEDIGLRNAVVGYRATDITKIMENSVFHHLQTLGYKIKVGKIGDLEIDFVIEKNNEKKYIQVVYTITPENQQREFGNLLKIKDNYEKIVISNDKIFANKNTFQGIKHWYVEDFFLKFK